MRVMVIPWQLVDVYQNGVLKKKEAQNQFIRPTIRALVEWKT